MKRNFTKSLIIALFAIGLTTSCSMISGKKCHEDKYKKECDGKMCKPSKDSSKDCNCHKSKSTKK